VKSVALTGSIMDGPPGPWLREPLAKRGIWPKSMLAHGSGGALAAQGVRAQTVFGDLWEHRIG
jgi:hypothetical protein